MEVSFQIFLLGLGILSLFIGLILRIISDLLLVRIVTREVIHSFCSGRDTVMDDLVQSVCFSSRSINLAFKPFVRLTLVMLRHTSEPPIFLRIKIPLLDKGKSSLLGLSDQILFGLREQFAHIQEPIFLNTHEDIFLCDHLTGVSISTECLFEAQCPDSNIGFQRFKNLIITKEAILWQVQNCHIFDALVVVVVEYLYDTLSNEIQVLDVGFVGDHRLAMGKESTEHVDDKLINKASLALAEEVFKVPFKLSECRGHLDKLGLHLRSYLLVEWELLDQ